MAFKLSEKRLLIAIILCIVGIYLLVNNAVDYSGKLISERNLLFQVFGIGLTVLGAITFYKAFKKA
jgi:hypothetical protein